jgi:hypothetical protein
LWNYIDHSPIKLEIKDNLSDDNPYNDQLVCDSIESQDGHTISNVRELLSNRCYLLKHRVLHMRRGELEMQDPSGIIVVGGNYHSLDSLKASCIGRQASL